MYNPQEVEKEILNFWRKNKIFEKLQKRNKGKKPWSFFDGPMTANNPMGVHHAWGRTYKDVYQRFRAMQGFDQRYQNGFDCQGLWVEVEVEKELGFNSKKEIEEYGLNKFSKACKARVKKYAKIQIEQSIKLGQWMDWENSYYTLDDSNIEHIWYFLKKCNEKGWLKKGAGVLPWCTRCGTALSQHELADSYKDATHTSIYFKVPIKNRKNESLLLWTTTPWTLSANVAAAVNPELDYVKVKQEDKIYYLSEKTVEKLEGEFKILNRIKGSKLIGLEYESPFDYLPVQKGIKHKIIPWEEVGEEEGTGIVHIAPSCGAEDYELGQKEELQEIPTPLDESGDYVKGFDWLAGKNVKKINDEVIQDLEKNGFLYKTEQYKHRYPVCWRCKEELVFRQESAWYISSDEIRPFMKKEAKKVTWYPEHAGKLMQDWLTNMQDWNISRKRFWGLPLMFYDCNCGHLEVIGTKKELKEKAIDRKLVDKLPELHRPWIDKIKISCPKCNEEVSRISDVGDCWLDAGIVPYSTLKYLSDKKYWKKWFPAEFITEMREQIRLWFYSMLFMSVTLEGKTPYKSVLVNEKVNDEKGNPMHKSLGNAIWFDDAVEKIGADPMRYMYANQNPQYNLNFGDTLARDAKKDLDVIWNLGNYINLYCKNQGKAESNLEIREKWIVSKRESLKKKVTENLDLLEIHVAIKEIKDYLVNDLSRWYGQLIREDLNNKKVQTVFYNSYIVGIKLLSPFLPFITDKLYSQSKEKEQSIHLENWPKFNPELIDETLENNMNYVKNVVQDILAEREKHQIGIRWPLKQVKITALNPPAVKQLQEIIKKQTNIKKIIVTRGEPNFELDTHLSPELEKEGFTREVIRRIQSLRRKAKLQKEDIITLELQSKVELNLDYLKELVNAKSIKELKDPLGQDTFKIKEKEFTVKIKR